MYVRPHYMFFVQIHSPYDGLTTYIIRIHIEEKEVTLLGHIRTTIDNIINQYII